jgi:hypothetical protein
MKEGKDVASLEYMLSLAHPSFKMEPAEYSKFLDSMKQLKKGGSLLNYELLTEEKLGDNYVHLDYVLYYEKRIIRFFCQFYKPKETWVLERFQFRDDIPEWAEEKAKYKYLKGPIKMDK